jgi:hypothetical protein
MTPQSKKNYSMWMFRIKIKVNSITCICTIHDMIDTVHVHVCTVQHLLSDATVYTDSTFFSLIQVIHNIYVCVHVQYTVATIIYIYI